MAEPRRREQRAPPAPSEPLLRAVDLTRHFRLGGMFAKQMLHAVDDFNFTIREREIVALVGRERQRQEHVARLLARVYPPTRGEIYYRGRPIQQPALAQGPALVPGRGGDGLPGSVQRVQPGASRLARGDAQPRAAPAGAEPRASAEREAERVFESVGLSPRCSRRFPYEMSGGERQRVGFAQALAVRPKLILADEPVSMLDVSIRAGVLNMMAGLRDQEGVSILYITHDLASARYVADRIIVMYAGHLVEAGPTETVLGDPKHPYTQLLLSAVADPRREGGVGLRRHRRAAAGDQPERGLPLPLALPVRDREVLAGHAPAEADRIDAGRLPRRGRRRRPPPDPPARPRSRTAEASRLTRPGSVELVIFDCDGVLIDSERLAIKVDVRGAARARLAAERGGGDRAVRRALRPRDPGGDRGAPRPHAAARLGRAGRAALPRGVRRRAGAGRGRARGARRDHAAELRRVERHARAPALHARADRACTSGSRGGSSAPRTSPRASRRRTCSCTPPSGWRPTPAALRGGRGQPLRRRGGARRRHARAGLRRRALAAPSSSTGRTRSCSTTCANCRGSSTASPVS